MSLVTETGAGRGPNFARRLSLPTLFLIGHAPLVAFAIGVGSCVVPILELANPRAQPSPTSTEPRPSAASGRNRVCSSDA
jgi:hypothetical protein